MILRDPVHGLVAFEGAHERVMVSLLEAREVQRLRNVRQLGFTSLVFPGAEHTRFAHALGAAHVMVRLLARVRAVQGSLAPELRVDTEIEVEALAAALLHDLGHGPFSHLFEEVLPGARHHEDWTRDVILDPRSDVHRVLKSLASSMPERVAALLDGTHPLGYLARSVSGVLDVDRCDYLLRDSHMTGVRYGIYDLDWLLRALSFGHIPGLSGESGCVLAIEGRKGLPPIEGFFLARLFMYQQVYHHKATRAAEMLIRAIFLRVAALIRDGRVPEQTPSAIVAAVRREPLHLGEYLALDDITLLAAFRAWERDTDETLAELTQRVTARRLPKTLPLSTEPSARASWQIAHERARDVAARRGYSPELWVWLDVPSECAYAEPAAAAPEALWVNLRHRPMERLAKTSFVLGELCNKRMERPRLIFPAEIRSDVVAALEGVLSDSTERPDGSAV
jgi:HD superfamily phosphohydrolase